MSRDFTPSADAPEAVAHLVSLLRDFEAATLITRGRAGGLQGRPTSIARVEDNATIWLVSSAACIEAEELLEDARAMLTFQAPSQFVSINGRAELVFGVAPVSARLASRFPGADAPNEPADALVRFAAFDAEYWDNSNARSSRHVFRAESARVTGHKLAEETEQLRDAGAHARLRLWAPDSARA
jgi:general stress protein 26